jgi:hypothetical protein
MIVLSEAKPLKSDFDDIEDSHRITRALQKNGWRVFHLLPEVASPNAADTMEEVPVQERETLGVWIGYVPSLSYYESIYEEARKRNISLVNTPKQHQELLETDHSLKKLRELTAESVVITSKEESAEAAARIGFPVFVKGVIFSQKQDGWSKCVANNQQELDAIVAQLLPRRFSRGKVIIRRLLHLKKSGEIFWGFPLCREFRFFLFRAHVLAYGFYWPLSTPGFVTLTKEEEVVVFALAQEAARRFEAPFVAIDIGQDEAGKWWVIESGDPQFAGLSFISPEEVAARMTALVR